MRTGPEVAPGRALASRGATLTARAVRRPFADDGRLLVVFLGPDGIGKSSVLAAASDRLRSAVPATRIVHLRPRVLRRRGTGDGPVLEPHGKPPKPRWASHLQLAYWWVDYQLDRLASAVRGRRELRWSDRYVDDVLIDPRRYRYGGSARFAAWIVARVPRPDLVVLLDAPADVVQARKREVPAAETERQRQAYLAYVRELANGRVVDAARPLDQVVADVVRLVADLLAERHVEPLEAVRG